MTFKNVVEVDIQVPQARLAGLFADPAKFTRWMHDMARVEPVSGELGMPGSRFRMVPKEGDWVFVATVLERNLPSEVDLDLDAEKLNISTKAFFQPLSADRTRLRHEQVFTFKGFFNKLLGAVARPAMRKAQRRHMEGFKRFAESGT
jgi:hypothetical protein